MDAEIEIIRALIAKQPRYSAYGHIAEWKCEYCDACIDHYIDRLNKADFQHKPDCPVQRGLDLLAARSLEQK